MTRHGMATTMLVGTVPRVRGALVPLPNPVPLSMLFAGESRRNRYRSWQQYRPSALNTAGFITDQWLLRVVRKAKSS